MIGVCTDSGARLPTEVAAELGVQVVPLTITLGDHDYLEGVDLSCDEIGRLLDDGQREVAVCQPSPGQFAAAYDELVADGCDEILSVHSSRADCNSLGAARLAAHSCDVPVRLVDCAASGVGGAFGFGLGCCAWAAAAAARSGASLEAVAAEVERAASRLLHVCVSAPFTDASGAPQFRLSTGDQAGDDQAGGRPQVVVTSPAETAEAMVDHLFSRGPISMVGIGGAGVGAQAIEDAVASSIAPLDGTVHVVRYRIGVAGWASRRLPVVGCFALPYP